MDDSTERRYEALRRRINREYRQAEKELREKLEEFFAKSAERDKEKRKLLADGKITKQEYQRWLRGQVFQGKRWQEKIDQAALQLTQVDETATAIVNGERLNVFADNMNYQNGEAERIIGARFDLYDSATVARLLDEQPNLLPPRRVKRSEDIPWYHKLINNCVTQGILQGESVPQIADRIGKQTGERGRTAMLRNARTACTSAQNAGRIEAMHRQQDMGIRVQKKWIAAIDNRTRRAHQELNGQTVDVDAPFQSILGEILFPGDPAAHPANVYNCRCRLGYVYPEYQPEYRQDDEGDEQSESENSIDTLNNQSESGIIARREARVLGDDNGEAYRYPKSDVIQKMQSFDEINEYFSRIDSRGEKQYLFSRSVRDLTLEQQKALAESMLYMQETFKQNGWPSTIRVQKTAKVDGKEVAGYYDPKSRKIVVSASCNKTETDYYLTGVHELIHHYDRYQTEAEYCVKQAIKKLKELKDANGNSTYSFAEIQLMRPAIAGSNYKQDDEILAYSIEQCLSLKNKCNPLAQMISQLFYERNARK